MATFTSTSKLSFLSCLLLAGFIFFAANPIWAGDALTPGEIPLDGLSAVISFNQSDESTAQLLLQSDVELLSRILLVFQHGESWQNHPVDNLIRQKALRFGVIVRILSHVAMQVGEKVDTTQRARWLSRFSVMAGGSRKLQTLFSQCGTTRNDLEYWFGNFQLCRIQLQYMGDKIQMPSQAELKKMFIEGDHPLAGTSWEEAQQVFEHIVHNKKLQRILADWLARFDKIGSVRYPR